MNNDIIVKVDMDTIECLNKIDNSITEDSDFHNPINKSIIIFSKLIDFTHEEIKDFFSDNELNLIIECLNCYLLQIDTIAPTKLLYAEISDAIHCEQLDKKWDVDKNDLLSKLKSLTEFQAFTLLNTITNCWQLK